MENYFEKSKIVSFLKWIFFIPLGFVSYYIGMTILNLAVVLVLSFFSLKDMLGGVLNSALGILGLLLIIYLYHYLAKFALAVMPNKSKSIPILIILLTIFQVFSVLVKGNNIEESVFINTRVMILTHIFCSVIFYWHLIRWKKDPIWER